MKANSTLSSPFPFFFKYLLVVAGCQSSQPCLRFLLLHFENIIERHLNFRPDACAPMPPLSKAIKVGADRLQPRFDGVSSAFISPSAASGRLSALVSSRLPPPRDVVSSRCFPAGVLGVACPPSAPPPCPPSCTGDGFRSTARLGRLKEAAGFNISGLFW